MIKCYSKNLNKTIYDNLIIKNISTINNTLKYTFLNLFNQTSIKRKGVLSNNYCLKNFSTNKKNKISKPIENSLVAENNNSKIEDTDNSKPKIENSSNIFSLKYKNYLKSEKYFASSNFNTIIMHSNVRFKLFFITIKENEII